MERCSNFKFTMTYHIFPLWASYGAFYPYGQALEKSDHEKLRMHYVASKLEVKDHILWQISGTRYRREKHFWKFHWCSENVKEYMSQNSYQDI